MKKKLKDLLRKTFFLQLSIIIHLIIAILFKQSQLNLRASLRASLSESDDTGIIMNQVSILKKRAALSPDKNEAKGHKPALHKPASEMLPAKIDVSGPQKKVTKVDQAFRLSENISQPEHSPTEFKAAKQTDSLKPEQGRSDTTIDKLSFLKNKQSATMDVSNLRDHTLTANLPPEKEFSVASIQEGIMPKQSPATNSSSSQQINEQTIVPAATSKPAETSENLELLHNRHNIEISQKLFEPELTYQDKEEKTTASSLDWHSHKENSAYNIVLDQPAPKITPAVDQANIISREHELPQPDRQAELPQGIEYEPTSGFNSEITDVLSNFSGRQHAVKVAYNYNSIDSAKNSFLKSADFSAKIADKTGDSPTLEEKSGQGETLTEETVRGASSAIREKVSSLSYKSNQIDDIERAAAVEFSSIVETRFSRIGQLVPSIHLDISTQLTGEPISVDKPNYQFQGSISSGVKQLFLKVNESLSSLALDQGKFQADISLKEGLNQIEMLAFSNNGQTVKENFSVLYTPLTMEWENKLRPSSWTTYINDRFSANNYVYAIALDKYRNRWFGMNSGVVRYNGHHWTSYTSQDGLASDQVFAIFSDQQGWLWFGTDQGVSCFNRVNWMNYTTEDGLVDNKVNAVMADGQGGLWFGTKGGVSRFDGKHWLSYTTKDGLVNNVVNAMAVDNQGGLWFGTQGGVSRFDGKHWLSYTTEEGLVNNVVNAMAADNQGRLWFGTKGGVSRFDGKHWVNYTTEEGLINNVVNAVAIDNQDRAWFGTQGGASLFDNGYWLSIGKKDGLVSNKVYAVLVESDARKWFGTDIGVSELTEDISGRAYR
jgi:sugar lactone lactonase YvrE